MARKERYEKARGKLLRDKSICKENRSLFREFFTFEERKLKRSNGLARLDEPSYKTLYEYILMFRNVNTWFRNKPWKKLTERDIRRVYDDLEDGKIKNRKGLPFRDRASYYNKIFKSKPFRLVGKSELARNVIEYYASNKDQDVRFVTEETFRKMVSVLSNPSHLLLFWLAWDLGENIDALLKLRKRDFVRQRHRQTKEPEYLVTFHRGTIKRSRTARTEPTLYAETVRYAEMILAGIKSDDLVFPFGYMQAWKIMNVVVKKTRASCMPNNNPVRWKDLRSGMACHVLKSGWTREEVDARLGHTPNSSALNAYINYLAIDREKPKKRIFDSSLEEIQNELEEAKRRERLTGDRVQRQTEENALLRSELELTRSDLKALRQVVERALGRKAA